MKQNLFIYTTNDGQTLKILNTIAAEVKDVAQTTYIDLNKHADTINFNDYDYILVASSIRYGHYAQKMYEFVNENKDILEQKKADFLSVNLTARKEGKDNPKTSGYIAKFAKKSLWQPNNIVMFAGLLAYPKYNFLDKRMIQFIMWLTKGETDTSKTVEYTDWQKVKAFAQQIKNQLI